jgi:hypothetical protein
MGRLRNRLSDVRFRCPGCLERWEGAPERVVDAPADTWHPWHYFATCPECGSEAHQDPQERALLKAWAHATGPTTPEGLERCREAGTEAAQKPRDPSVLARTRFNGLKHGLNAKVATFYPARPGKYPHCNGCEYFVECGITSQACLKRAELFLKHHVAFETRNPELLNGLNAELHANLRALLDDMILAVIGDGAVLRAPEWFVDKDGRVRIAMYIDDKGEEKILQKIEANPLLKHIKELVQAAGLSLADLAMTPKVHQQQEELTGQLAGQRVAQENLLDYQRRQTEALESLSGLIQRAREAAAADPVLIEHQQMQADG